MNAFGYVFDSSLNRWIPVLADTSGRVRVIMDGSIPPGTSNIGDVDILSTPVVGAHANAWNAAVVGAAGVSSSVDTQFMPNVSAFGSLSAVSTITMMLSQDNVNFYDGPSVAGTVAGGFVINAVIGARYVRLKSSAAATITGTIAAKS